MLSDTEKITINLSPMDIGHIDLLVEQGFYANRTDLIKVAIRNQIDKHSDDIKNIHIHKYYVLGVLELTSSNLMSKLASGEKMDIKLIGKLTIHDDVEMDLLIKTINSVRVYGIIKASPSVKKWVQSLMRKEGR